MISEDGAIIGSIRAKEADGTVDIGKLMFIQNVGTGVMEKDFWKR